MDEPRAEKPEDTKAQLSLFDERGRQKAGWTNKLIWGGNGEVSEAGSKKSKEELERLRKAANRIPRGLPGSSAARSGRSWASATGC